MKMLKKTLWMACVLFGSFSSTFALAEETKKQFSFEYRLQQLGQETNQTDRLQRLLDLYWDWNLAEHPDYATYLGESTYNHLWPDLSLEAIERRASFIKQSMLVLQTIEEHKLKEEESINYQLIQRELKESLEDMNFQEHYMPLNQISGIHLDAPLIISLMPNQTVYDYQNILARLYRFPVLIDQIIELLKKGVELGITPPKVAMQHVPKQVLNQLVEDPLQSPFLKPFSQFSASIAIETQHYLTTSAKDLYEHQVVPALSKLYDCLIHSYLPSCRKEISFTSLPNGEEWYAFKIKQMTTTSLSAQEIHQIGLQEVERIFKEMQAIQSSVPFIGSFNEFIHFIKTEGQFFYSDRQALLQGYQSLIHHIESRLPLLFSTLPSLPFEIVSVPSYSEENQIAAYYCPGSVAQKRPGHFFINTNHLENRPKWEMEPLVLHEALPGHHLQQTLTQELNHLPEFRKHLNYTAYIEGWGLYAESLGKELGLYQDPYSQFGRLSYEMLRAIRLVVDTGMHKMRWSRERAITYFKQYTAMSEHDIITEVDRYLVMPGQVLAYKIGELKIKEWRERAQKTLGPLFDRREFHEEWLRQGTLPLDIADRLMQKWLNNKRS